MSGSIFFFNVREKYEQNSEEKTCTFNGNERDLFQPVHGLFIKFPNKQANFIIDFKS